MVSAEKHYSKSTESHQDLSDNHSASLTNQVREIMSRGDGAKSNHENLSGKAAMPSISREQLLSSILDDSVTPEKRLNAVKLLVGDQGHMDVTVRDSEGRMRKLRLEVESVGGSRNLIHVLDESGDVGKNSKTKNHTLVFLRGVSESDGSFSPQKDKNGRSVSYSPDRIGEVALVNETLASETQPKSTRQVEALEAPKASQESPVSKQLTEVEITGGHRASGTAYYPHNSKLEGGFKDKIGKQLRTLEDYLAGKAPYVSVAMDDRSGFKYGQKLRIPELEQKYGKQIPFRIVDTGGAFRGKGTSRIDICVANEKASNDPVINGNLTLQFV